MADITSMKMQQMAIYFATTANILFVAIIAMIVYGCVSAFKKKEGANTLLFGAIALALCLAPCVMSHTMYVQMAARRSAVETMMTKPHMGALPQA